MVCALVLAGAYVYFFTDWFAPSDIQIIHTIRPNTQAGRRPRGREPVRASSHLVSFAFSQKLRLKDIQVVPASDAATNKYPHPLWHLLSDSNSVPTKSIVYGLYVRGMRPAVKGAMADPLEPGTAYQLRMASDAGKIQHDFKTPASLPPTK